MKQSVVFDFYEFHDVQSFEFRDLKHFDVSKRGICIFREKHSSCALSRKTCLENYSLFRLRPDSSFRAQQCILQTLGAPNVGAHLQRYTSPGRLARERRGKELAKLFLRGMQTRRGGGWDLLFQATK